MRRLISVLALLVVAGSALAIDDQEALADPALQARYVRLGNELRCLVCQNQSIADSTADLAADLRGQVRQMLLDGATDAEILDYMVARYGEFVRYRPAFNPRTWALWLGPFAMLGIGVVVVAVIIRRYSHLDSEAAND